jgi:predicted phosphodiesterase
MRLLHLSDLHVTDDQQTLHSIGTSILGTIDGEKFDFIIVSGDLSQKAQAAEYVKLRTFTRNFLSTLLREPDDIHRIIFVPGNHDVDWEKPVMKHIPIQQAEENYGELVQLFRGHSKIRTSMTKHGLIETYEILTDTYHTRFENVGNFLDELYSVSQNKQDIRHRVYQNLPSTNDPQFIPFDFSRKGCDWSLHFYPKEKIAFIGFNSCHMNDQLWHGASICKSTISEVRRFIRELPNDTILVAVWHHGLGADLMRPDYLTLSDLGSLSSLGFQIGFHGHTHEAAYQSFGELFSDDFLVVSTGSLVAGSQQRPAAIGNQFSTVELVSGFADIRTFGLTETTNIWKQEARKIAGLTSRDDNWENLSSCRKHQRCYKIKQDGILDATIKLEGLSMESELTLAVIREPYCAVTFNNAETSDRNILETSDIAKNGSIKIKCNSPGQTGNGRIDISCTYSASNAFPLSVADQERMIQESDHHPSLPPGWFGRPHTVRIPTDMLILDFEFCGNQKVSKEPIGVAEKCVDGKWIRVDSEQIKLSATKITDDHLQLIVRWPVLGFRYTLAFKLVDQNDTHDRILKSIISTIHSQCRMLLNSSLRVTLSQSIENALKLCLECDEIEYVGFMWDENQKHLSPCFGTVRPDSWGKRFPYGIGVVGHSFRFGEIAMWHKDHDAERNSLIYRPIGNADHEWILCIPIKTTTDHTPLGVVSIVHREGGKLSGQACELADRVLMGDINSDWCDKLETNVMLSFWECVHAFEIGGHRTQEIVGRLNKMVGQVDKKKT